MNKKEFAIVFLISISTYLLFFYSLWDPSNLIWGSDLEYKHLPSRWYLFQQITEFGRFPFWTEKMFGGYPIYADSELGFLNPFNLISLLIFGPALSLKVMHIVSYLVGSFSLYFLVKRLGYGFWAFILSNAIYFFSFYLINHQIHFNLIMIAYLIPLNILFTDKLVNEIKTGSLSSILKQILFNGILLAYGLYWGHYQTSLFIVMLMSFYCIGSISKPYIRNSLKYLISLFIIGITSIILSLPQTLPTLEVYMASDRRASEEINLYEGSFSPSLLPLTFFPQVWGTWDTFYGKMFNEDYSYTEFYIYLGISAIIIVGMLFMVTKFNKLSVVFLLSYYSFIFFGFISFMPFITPDFFGLSGFRYWVRSVLMLIFGMALFSIRIEDLLCKDNSKLALSYKSIFPKLLLLIFPLLCLLILNEINPNNVVNFNLFEGLNYRNLLKTPMGYEWAITGLITLITISLAILKKSNTKVSRWIIIFAVLVSLYDLRHFGSDPLDARIDKYEIPQPAIVPDNLKGVRLIYNESLASGQRALYQDIWTPLGYSQFAPNKYADKFMSIDVDIISSRGKSFEDYEYLDELYELGVMGIFEKNEFKISQEIPEVWFVKQADFDAKQIQSVETGTYSFLIETKEPQIIQTFLKNDPGMLISINGREIEREPRDTFIRLPLSQGISIININYHPKLFYWGILASVMYLLLFSGVIRVADYRKRISA